MSGDGLLTLHNRDYRRGIRKPSAMVSIIAAATPITLYLLTATRTGVMRRLHIANHNGAATQVQIGTGLGVGFVQAIPDILVPAGADVELFDAEIANVEFAANITVQASVAGAAPANVLIECGVEEFEGTGA